MSVKVNESICNCTIEKILENNRFDINALIAILQDTQREFGYIPKDAIEAIAKGLSVPISRVYAVVTFYKAFKLSPSGKHVVKVCLGTACHIKGGPELMRQLESNLGVKPEEVTPDGQFSYEAVRCVGCCGLAPVVMVDETFYGKATPNQMKKYLKNHED